MRRRDFIAATAAAVAGWPLAARGQRAERMRRVGYLRAGPPPTREIDAFRSGLAALGFVEGQNLVLVPGWGDGNPGGLPALAGKLVSADAEVIVAEGSLAMRAAHQASPSAPIVFARSADPFVGGLVSSLSRPAGRVTGLSMQAVELTGKMIDLLKELVPGLSRISMIAPRAVWPMFAPVQDQAAQSLGIESIHVDLKDADKPADAMQEAVAAKASGAILRGTPFYSSAQRKGLVEAASAHRMPMIYESREYVEQGGLAAYATDGVETYRLVAQYVAKILNGAQPGELPIQQPTKFELSINARTARALGLAVPPRLLFTADEVIE